MTTMAAREDPRIYTRYFWEQIPPHHWHLLVDLTNVNPEEATRVRERARVAAYNWARRHGYRAETRTAGTSYEVRLTPLHPRRAVVTCTYDPRPHDHTDACENVRYITRPEPED